MEQQGSRAGTPSSTSAREARQADRDRRRDERAKRLSQSSEYPLGTTAAADRGQQLHRLNDSVLTATTATTVSDDGAPYNKDTKVGGKSPAATTDGDDDRHAQSHNCSVLVPISATTSNNNNRVIEYHHDDDDDGDELEGFVDVAIHQYLSSCGRYRTSPDPAVLAALEGIVKPIGDVVGSLTSSSQPQTQNGNINNNTLCFLLNNKTLMKSSNTEICSNTTNTAAGAGVPMAPALVDFTRGAHSNTNTTTTATGRLAGLSALMEGLVGIPLTILSLKDCYIQDSGLQLIASSIGSNPTLMNTLMEVDLRGNGLHGESCSGISYILSSCRSLRSLRLGWNKLGFDGGAGGNTQYHFQQQQQPTSCPRHHYDDGVVEDLQHHHHSGIGSLFATIRSHRQLQFFDVSNNMIVGSPFTLLPLVELILSRTPATLQHIDLSWNSLSSSGSRSNTTTHMDGMLQRGATSSSGTDAGAALHGAIIRNNTIQELLLEGNGFTRREMEAITAKLYANQRQAVDAQVAESAQCNLVKEVRSLQGELKAARVKFVASEHSRKEDRKSFMDLQNIDRIKISTQEQELEKMQKQLATQRDNHDTEASELRAALRAAEERIEKHSTRCDDLESKNDALRKELGTHVDTIRKNSDVSAETIASRVRDINALEDRVNGLTASLDKSNLDYQTTLTELSLKRNEVVRLQSEVESTTLEASRAKSAKTVQEEELLSVKDRLKEQSSQVTKLSSDLQEMEVIRTRLERQVAEHDEKCNRVAEDVKRSEKAEAARAVQQLEMQLQRKEDAISRLEDRSNETTQSSLHLQQKLQSEIDKLIIKDEQREEVQQRLRTSELEVSRLSRVEVSLEAKINTLSEQLGRSEADTTRRVMQTEHRLTEEITALERHFAAKAAELDRAEMEVARLKRRLIDVQQASRQRVQRLEERLVINLRQALHTSIDGEEEDGAKEGDDFYTKDSESYKLVTKDMRRNNNNNNITASKARAIQPSITTGISRSLQEVAAATTTTSYAVPNSTTTRSSAIVMDKPTTPPAPVSPQASPTTVKKSESVGRNSEAVDGNSNHAATTPSTHHSSPSKSPSPSNTSPSSPPPKSISEPSSSPLKRHSVDTNTTTQTTPSPKLGAGVVLEGSRGSSVHSAVNEPSYHRETEIHENDDTPAKAVVPTTSVSHHDTSSAADAVIAAAAAAAAASRTVLPANNTMMPSKAYSDGSFSDYESSSSPYEGNLSTTDEDD